jgi:Leucine-rich repeat (LRR) protein
MKPIIHICLTLSILLITGCQPLEHSLAQTPSPSISYLYYYSKNGLEILPSNADTIYISNTDISEFPDSLLKYTNITEIIIDNTNISNLPEGICALVGLKKLTIGGNRFKTLPSWIGCLKNLSSLLISENQFEYLPPEIGSLTSLEDLSIDGTCCSSPAQKPAPNRLVSLPHAIGRLSNLKSIFIYETALESLPEELYQLTNLQNLLIMDDNLQFVSPTIENLTNLKRLDLSNNQHLFALPSEIGNLPSLQELDLFGTDIDGLPASITGSAHIKIFGFGNYYYSLLLPTESLPGLSNKDIAKELLNNWLQKKYFGIYRIDNLDCSNSDCSTFTANWHSLLFLRGGGIYRFERWKKFYGLLGPYSCC